MVRRVKPLVTFICDSREQAPYQFCAPRRKELGDGGFYSDTLPEGDYTVELDGERLDCLVERKSLADLFMSAGRNRETFAAELARLAEHRRAILVIEATAAQIARGYERSLVSGRAALNSTLCWIVSLGIVPLYAGTRRGGEYLTQTVLEEAAIHALRSGGCEL